MDTHFFLGLDLGQVSDFTALSLIEWVPDSWPAYYHLRHLERFPLGTRYPDIVERVKRLMLSYELRERTVCIPDKTGVGAPVVDMLYRARMGRVIPITITGGLNVHWTEYEYSVPKRDLVSTLQVLFQNRRLKFSKTIPEIGILIQELKNFRVKINLATGHDSYEAWREGQHDDMVLSLALACWFAERNVKYARSHDFLLDLDDGIWSRRDIYDDRKDPFNDWLY